MYSLSMFCELGYVPSWVVPGYEGWAEVPGRQQKGESLLPPFHPRPLRSGGQGWG